MINHFRLSRRLVIWILLTFPSLTFCLQRLRSRSQKFMWWSITGRYHSISDCLVPRLYAKKFIFYFRFSIFLVTFFRVPKFVAKLKYLFLHLCLRISNWNQFQLTEKFQGTTQFIWHETDTMIVKASRHVCFWKTGVIVKMLPLARISGYNFSS